MLRLVRRRGARGDEPVESMAVAGPESSGPSVDVVPIADLVPRQRAQVLGEVQSITLRPRENTPALVVEVADESGTLRLVWLGRRRIRGIDPGVLLRVRGRISVHGKTLIMFNPFYEIVLTEPGAP